MGTQYQDVNSRASRDMDRSVANRRLTLRECIAKDSDVLPPRSLTGWLVG